MSTATLRSGPDQRADHDRGSTEVADPRPLGGHAVLLATYSLGATAAVICLSRRRAALPRFGVGRFVVLALATQHLSRLIAKDTVTSPLRAPFTRFVQSSGEGEVEEEVVGSGLRHAVGELITCPFCLSQWVASGLVLGSVAAPSVTGGFAVACALARTSDYLQLAYDRLKSDA